jgi:hypothetical protein
MKVVCQTENVVFTLNITTFLHTLLQEYTKGFINHYNEYRIFSCIIFSIRIDHVLLQTAMAAHRSQYVWFRKLYMNFSRYAVINTFKEIEILDLELDLELDDWMCKGADCVASVFQHLSIHRLVFTPSLGLFS